MTVFHPIEFVLGVVCTVAAICVYEMIVDWRRR